MAERISIEITTIDDPIAWLGIEGAQDVEAPPPCGGSLTVEPASARNPMKRYVRKTTAAIDHRSLSMNSLNSASTTAIMGAALDLRGIAHHLYKDIL